MPCHTKTCVPGSDVERRSNATTLARHAAAKVRSGQVTRAALTCPHPGCARALNDGELRRLLDKKTPVGKISLSLSLPASRPFGMLCGLSFADYMDPHALPCLV